MLRFNAKMGYASITLFGVMFLVVWGWCGNMYYYGCRATIRIDIGSSTMGTSAVSIITGNLETTFSHTIGPVYRPFWNSEHIAVWYGEYQDSEYHPGWYDYRGIFGSHVAI